MSHYAVSNAKLMRSPLPPVPRKKKNKEKKGKLGNICYRNTISGPLTYNIISLRLE